MFTDIIILAGGVGKRLWPASTEDTPKQFMELFNGLSFLQETLLRSFSLQVPGKIIIITNEKYIENVKSDIFELYEKNKELRECYILNKIIIIAEPCGKNTAPAAALVSKFLLEYQKNVCNAEFVNMLILPSDHIIKDIDKFSQNIKIGAKFCEEGKIVIFGIPPCNAETGFGYIEKGVEIAPNVYKTASFKEKPDQATAEKYLSKNKYFWNSGIYGMRADIYLSELALYSKEVYNCFSSMSFDFSESTTQEHDIMTIVNIPEINAAYNRTPSISIDYAISEKSKEIVIVESGFDWDDAGNWDAISKYDSISQNFSALQSDTGNFVFSDIPVAICGASDLIIVIKNGNALVMKKGCGNEIKDVLP